MKKLSFVLIFCSSLAFGRNYFWPPVVSMLLPGFDQWKTHEYGSAAAYSGIGAAGLITAASLYEPNHVYKINSHNDKDRTVQLAMQSYQVVGSLSLYQSFRGIAKEREDFSFLSNEETMKDVTTAAFRFDYLIRPTTFVPLLIIGAIAVLDVQDGRERYVTPTGSDVFFSTAFSYGAGTGEEALFRGWLMPVSRRWFGSNFWSNTSRRCGHLVAMRKGC